MRACSAGLPLTVTVPAVGRRRSPMSRSSVDLPQPDGPMSETNSPCRMSRSMPRRAVSDCPSGSMNSLSSPATDTTLGVVIGPISAGRRRRPVAQYAELEQPYQAVEGDAEDGGDEDGSPQLL